MRQYFGVLFLTILSLPMFAQAQLQQDSVRFCEYIAVKHADAADWVTRYQTEIDKYVDENKNLKDKSCDVLFWEALPLIYGIIFIKIWLP